MLTPRPMLSYQHAYHAGNLADVHKHALLAWALDAMARKPKPLSYLETHAGRGRWARATRRQARVRRLPRAMRPSMAIAPPINP